MDLHIPLCHSGITRMAHFLRSKNISCSVDDVCKLVNSCSVCQKLKPRYLRSSGTLIHATQPLERINIDFKGPLPSASKNKYILSGGRVQSLPFCLLHMPADMNSSTVTKCFVQLFSLFGMPGYVHSDRGPSFISEEVKTFLHSRG